MLSIEAIIQLYAYSILPHQIPNSLHSFTMAETPSSPTDTSQNKALIQDHLQNEPKSSESSVTQPVAESPSDGNTAEVEETAEEETRRKKYFDKFAKRFFKVEGVGDVFKKDDEVK
jgi:hypothetical protein